MSRKLVLLMTLTFALVGMLGVAVKVQKARASGTVYIRADGSVDPSTAPIHRDGNIYALTSNINGSIVVERNNIVVDGKGHTIQGIGGSGVVLGFRRNVTIENAEIAGFDYGIYLYTSKKNRISRNNITDSQFGIWLLEFSHYNSIYENTIRNNEETGIRIDTSTGNSIFGNKIENHSRDTGAAIWGGSCTYSSIFENDIRNNKIGIRLLWSSDNHIWHNNFIGNTRHASTQSSVNVWDNSYPSGGNYWSNYNGTDLHGGPYQNETGSDGIGDRLYLIDAKKC